VVYRTPGWDDFVQLSCREIRLYGAANFQMHPGCAGEDNLPTVAELRPHAAALLRQLAIEAGPSGR